MRVVSGIQPTGGLHLGNLLGAILRWVRMQDEAECLFFLADLHALTVDVDPLELGSNVREMAAALFASGIIIQDSFNNGDSLYRAMVSKEICQADRLVKLEKRF